MNRRRQSYFHDKQCAVCGSKERLELDHIDRSQKSSHRIWSLAKEKRDAEIAKCQVLCHDCHWKKTYKDMNYGNPTHGKSSTYKEYKCRCQPCCDAFRELGRRYRAKRKAEGR